MKLQEVIVQSSQKLLASRAWSSPSKKPERSLHNRSIEIG